MRLSSSITKLWREVFRQEGPLPQHAPAHVSPDWIRERVHAALVGETFQGKGDEREQRREDGQDRDQPQSLQVGWRTDPGLARRSKPNEDSLFAASGTRGGQRRPQDFGLFIVADGMGGHSFGQQASRLAIQTMTEWVLPQLARGDEPGEAECREILILGAQAANQVLYRRNEEQGTRMGTTINAVLVRGSTAFVVNVGDSRTYLYREASGLRKITRDHSLVAYLVESGIIRPDDIYRHPQRNQIYRSLGSEPFIPIDAFVEPLRPGDTLVLCSDGLWEMVRDQGMQEMLRQAAFPAQASYALVDAALEAGGTDNVSVIVVRVAGPESCGSESCLQLLAKPETCEAPAPFPYELKRSR